MVGAVPQGRELADFPQLRQPPQPSLKWNESGIQWFMPSAVADLHPSMSTHLGGELEVSIIHGTRQPVEALDLHRNADCTI